MDSRRADLALLAVALIWGINIPAMKYALGVFDPFTFNAMRLTLSVLVLGWLERLERRGARPPPTPWARVVLVAILASVGYQILFVLGMARTTAGNTALILASSPIWTAAFAGIAGAERLGRGAWSGLTLAFLGTSLVTLDPRGDGDLLDLAPTYLTGNLIVLASTLLWAAGTVASKPVVQRVSPTRLAFLFTLISLPAHLLLAVPSAFQAARGGADTAAWLCVAYAGVFSTGIAYALWNFGVRKVGPSHTAVTTNLVPLIALLGSWVVLHETITSIQLAGGALILGGLVLMRRSR